MPTSDLPHSHRNRMAPSRRIFAIGDIHGRIDHLDRLLERIFALMRGVPMEDEMVFLGDYIDRGNASSDVISRLAGLGGDALPMAFLKGNHEDMMLRFLMEDDDNEGLNWIVNGGRATIMSYGLDFPDDLRDPEDFDALRDLILGAIPSEHLDFLAHLDLIYQSNGYIFVHAGLRPGIPVSHQRADDLMWIRGPFLRSREDFGAIVIHGHTPTEHPEIHANRIGIDTGAFMDGCLTAAVITDGGPTFLTSRAEL